MTPKKVIVIGCSAGGILQLQHLFAHLKKLTNCSLIVVQHIGKQQSSSSLANIFQNKDIHIKIPFDKEPIVTNNAYLAPPDYHIMVGQQKEIELSIDAEVNYSRPSIDVLFETAAEVYQNNLLGIILSGANYDGAQGIINIHNNGGETIAQEPGEAPYSYMPSAAIRTGHVHKILNLDQIIDRINQLNS